MAHFRICSLDQIKVAFLESSEKFLQLSKQASSFLNVCFQFDGIDIP